MKLWPAWERRKNDLNAELEAHLRIAVEERIANGESPEEARTAALREMGNPPLVADVTRESWGWQGLERIIQDVRYALRQLIKSPGYTATALLTLTLAIGANTAIFGILYALMLRSLPVQHPEQIVQLQRQLVAHNGHRDEPGTMLGQEMYDSVAPHQTVFSGMCAWQSMDLNLRDAQGTQAISSATITGGCLPMLGVHAALGRLLSPADDKPGGSPEGFPVVLGYEYWRTHLGADPNVLGRTLTFGATFYSTDVHKGVIVGVMQPGFESITAGESPWVYAPLEMNYPAARREWGSANTAVLGRLKDGVTPQQAQAQVDTLFNAQLKKRNGYNYAIFGPNGIEKAAETHLLVTSGRTGYSFVRSYYAKPLYLVEGMVGLSLIVACAYLALLSSARAFSRRRELAIRIALGASRRRVAAQLWYESALLAIAGGGLGVLFAWAASRVLVALMKRGYSDTPVVLHTGPGGVVLLFTLGIMAFTVLVSGVLPAWRGSRLDPVRDIKEGETTHSGRRLPVGAWLVPIEIGLSLVIVVLAALMGSTVTRLLQIDPGFRTSGVTFLRTDFSQRVQPHGKDKPPGVPNALLVALLDRVQRAPGVESASISQAHPLGGGSYMYTVSAQKPTGGVIEDKDMLDVNASPGYFATLGIPLLAGRDFNLQDQGEEAHVCILSRGAADYFFPGGHALGGTVTVDDWHMQVIGVAGDTLYGSLRDQAQRMIYMPYLSGSQWNPYVTVAVRSPNAATAATAVRNALRDLAPDVSVNAPITMNELVNGSMSRERMVALLAGFFAVLTLVLSAIGMYGLLNYSVVRRKREIGVRMALGASRGNVVRLVMREALWMVLPGLVLGAVGAWAATRFVQSLLFGVRPLDPWVLAASAAVLLATAIAACLLPARRAAGVHPMEALRFE